MFSVTIYTNERPHGGETPFRNGKARPQAYTGVKLRDFVYCDSLPDAIKLAERTCDGENLVAAIDTYTGRIQPLVYVNGYGLRRAAECGTSRKAIRKHARKSAVWHMELARKVAELLDGKN